MSVKTNNLTQSKDKYDAFDLAKYILSFFIVAIHVNLFPQYTYPWLNIAVPLFFMMSAFLLTKKINKEPENKDKIIKKFVIRQLQLYLFWFILLLPITIDTKKSWFNEGIPMGIYRCISHTLLSSTFITSWYIVASIWAVLIIWKFCSKVDSKKLTIIFTIIYIICCFRSSWIVRLNTIPIIETTIRYFETILVNPTFSIPVALFWVNLGKLFAEDKIKIPSKKTHIISTISFGILLYVEWLISVKYEARYVSSCFFFLAPLVTCIFAFLLNWKITLKNGYTLRKISVITYPLHASVLRIITPIINNHITNSTIALFVNFATTIIICHLVYVLFKNITKLKWFNFVKVAY